MTQTGEMIEWEAQGCASAGGAPSASIETEAPLTHSRPLWQKAVSFAARAHNGQYRKDRKTPFCAHVFRVCMTLRELFGCTDEIALCAAVLHDTIEDTPTDFDDIEKRFGHEVAVTVAALTKNMLLREPEREADYDRRLIASDWRAKLVKLADVYDNGCDIVGGEKAIRRNAGRARRAIAIAQPEAGRVPEIARAIKFVTALADHLEAQLEDQPSPKKA